MDEQYLFNDLEAQQLHPNSHGVHFNCCHDPDEGESIHMRLTVEVTGPRQAKAGTAPLEIDAIYLDAVFRDTRYFPLHTGIPYMTDAKDFAFRDFWLMYQQGTAVLMLHLNDPQQAFSFRYVPHERRTIIGSLETDWFAIEERDFEKVADFVAYVNEVRG